MQKIAAALLFLALPVSAADPAWIEYGADPDTAIARTIVTTGGDCPAIAIDGVERKMAVRAAATEDYEVTVCEASFPRSAQSVRIGGTELPARKLNAHAKVALLGDTGCRRKEGDPPQDCDDAAAWPFATVAASIAKWDPDLVLHVGDYYYREAKSCNDKGKCKGKVYDWKRWNADFFEPAAPLLANAPWVFVRGNHEECKRAGEGWFRFLDPRRFTWESAAQCKSNLNFTPPYLVNAGGMQLIVLDSSALKENDKDQAKMIASQLELFGGLSGDAWLMLHHPFWGARSKDRTETETLWKAWSRAGTATKPISLVLTGHTHLLQVTSFGDGRPPQAIVGNGGTALAKKADQPASIGGRSVKHFMQYDDFGFIAATPSAGGWTFDVRDVNGNSVGRCAVTATSIVCD